MQEQIEVTLKQLANNFKLGLSEYEGFDIDKFLTPELENKIKFVTKAYIEVQERVFDENEFKTAFSHALRWFRANQPVTIERGYHLKKKIETWLTEARKSKIGWGDGSNKTYRDRYFEYLNDIGRPSDVIKEAEESTLRIVSSLSDPEKNESFFTKALIVGSVQSGKTANFNGVINTAIDSGFKLIIVLSGIMEDLRRQTQQRIEKEVIGFNQKGVGVKRYNADHINKITSDEADFSTTLMNAQTNLHNPSGNILICKKNVSVLRNILIWLEGQKQSEGELSIPMLIIDDEADNASLNNLGHKRAPEFATKTNMLIRAILAMTNRKSYLGYTATPFANILQDRNEARESNYELAYRGADYSFPLEDNLFPDHFIELLNPPSNYTGIKQFFDTRNEDIKKVNGLVARAIDLDDPLYFMSVPPRFFKNSDEQTTSIETGTRAAKSLDGFPNKKNRLPKSLEEGVYCFVLSIAMKLSREEKIQKQPNYWAKHRTMLIHISLFSQWQNDLEPLIITFLEKIITKINNQNQGTGVWSDFKRMWNKHYKYIVTNIHNDLSYKDEYMMPLNYENDVQDFLYEALKGIEVVTLNSSRINNGKKLIYNDNDPKKYIAIGGNRLSRGFTLEGLTINYFLRKANTVDTLMQMARWFGYKPGYLDSCKLFTISKNIEKFNEASLIMEDLEDKFKYLASLDGRQPSDYTLWIRNNPDVIKLTRSNFLKGTTLKHLSFSDVVEQGTDYKIEKDLILDSFKEFKEHVQKLKWTREPDKKGYLFHDTDKDGLLSFTKLKSTMMNLNILGLEEYLELCAAENKLTNWRIALKTPASKGGKVQMKINNSNKEFNMIIRSGPSIGPDIKSPSSSFLKLTVDNVFKVKNSNIISPPDFSVTLTANEKKKVETEYKRNNQNKSVPDMAYRESMDQSTGILIIYLMDLSNVFNLEKDTESTKELNKYSKEKGLDGVVGTPLIGYAIGFPKIEGVKNGIELTQHFFPEPKDMTFEQLQSFVVSKDYNIDPLDGSWTLDSLLKLVLDIEEDESKADDEAANEDVDTIKEMDDSIEE